MPKKKRGRPATGKDPQVVLRMPAKMRGDIVKWGQKQPDKPLFSEAARRLIELALEVSSLG